MPRYPYGPSGGINQEDPPVLLEENQVASSLNFLFENGVCASRPGLIERTKSVITRQILYAFSSDSWLNGPRTHYVTWNGATTGIVREEPNGTITEMIWETTAGTPFYLDASFSTMAMVNGNLMIGGGTEGLGHIPLTSGTVETIESAKWKFVVGHKARAVAAYGLGGDYAREITVGWSAPGLEKDWTSFGYGKTILSEAVGPITGLANINDVIIVGRKDGFHLGRATGNAIAAFEWDCVSSLSVGPQDHNDFCSDGEACYFIGQDDVYVFDGVSSPASIGRAIRQEIISYARNGVKFKGFICRGIGGKARKQYHLVPINRQSIPHFVFDIADGKWSRHLYDFITAGGWAQVDLDGRPRPAICAMDQVSKIRYWDETLNCEQSSRLFGRDITYGDTSSDWTVDKLLLVGRNLGNEPVSIRCNVSASSASPDRSGSADLLLHPEQRFTRAHWNVRNTGTFHRFDVVVPPDSRVEIAQLNVEVKSGGQYTRSSRDGE